MLDIEIDGKALQVAEGSTIIEAAHQLGTYIPHFCYHKKLSIAANCRMCLVQVEKAPKPMPACATPVTNGMKVQTHSEQAVGAQKGVMEFLLINHPLDCPICDQGGECQLQDLAVGYGASASRYQEEKRVVMNKNLGPLVATDMTRCINCTRCVRFTQEIAGLMELGQAFRGEHAEIMSFIGQTVDSELSGNIIDLCPVGALTSKPFRFSARTWELARRKSVSPHDGLGANLIVQVKHDRVMRVLPLDNEDINECWLSDKDRFSYEGLNSPERLTRPMLKHGGQWHEVDWQQALDYVAHAFKDIAKNHGGAALGALLSPHATLEELHLGQKLMRGLGSGNVDFRLRQSDFSQDGKRQGAPWLGMKISEINALDRVLVVGSFLRKDQPLIAQRLRQIAKRGAQVSLLHCCDDDQLIKIHAKAIVPPSQLPRLLAQVVKCAAEAKGVAVDAAIGAVTVSAEARAIAASLASGVNSGSNTAVFLGNLAQQHAQAATLQALAQQLASLTGARFGFLGEAANSVGGYVADALPGSGGLNAAAMLAAPRQAYLLLNAEPELDCADPQQAMAALQQAETVVVLSPFKPAGALDYADVLLPVSPFTETSGSFVNTEGRVQSFNAVVQPLGETRPAWKVLRVLGNLLGLQGFEQGSSEAVRAEVLGEAKPEFVAERLDNGAGGAALDLSATAGALERVADVPIYFADALVRRAPSLQRARDAVQPTARMNSAVMSKLGITPGQQLRIKQGAGSAVLMAELDERLPEGAVRIAAAHPSVAGLSGLQGAIIVEAL
ncbi:NADH-quinone oxidoreductase chain 3 [mine drainage metagenome]|uniref:NADH-quinone oxidoreductase chain 3 n=1 Tax=mine drainage metagenome TaxID=410659 RepID=A0A1J5SGF3_9ZZZZ